MKPWLLCAILGLVPCGCRALPEPAASFPPFPENDDPYFPAPSAPSEDLGVPASPGTVRSVDEPWRTIEGAPSGRVRMLEMYQAAVAQRDKSAQRAADLERDLGVALARITEAEKARADLEVRNAGLSSELREIHSKALELARRLAQAEFSLLGAEKADLQFRASEAAKRRTP